MLGGYLGGGRPSFHPKLMTKIVIYVSPQRIYPSRQIAEAVRENTPLHVACRSAAARRKRICSSLPKVSIEDGWLSLVHNLLKRATLSQKAKCGRSGASL
ncbi:transposase [Paenibacillus thailandensis]|uniref:Transposase n=1 Tax=Paenibacillus thailandensis TaxID=393250 RepID=A0ABW5QY76_9BACL